MTTPCIVCEELCPTDPKAIWLERVEEPGRDGRPVRLARPRVEAAIRVTSVGESRDPLNRMLLEN